MPQLRHIIPKHQEKALWALKDKLEVLSRDPVHLHKTAFVEYLRAKGEQLYAEAANEADVQAADAYLTKLTLDWKAEAERRFHARTA